MEKDLYLSGRRLPVLEEFYTLQGEGFNTGKAAYFLRIGGCDIGCSWCDSKLSWSGNTFPMTAVDAVIGRAKQFPAKALVVTGGEPALFPLDYLCDRLHEEEFETFIETSGAYPLSGTWDWVCLSPKRQSPPYPDNFTKAHELKVIIEQPADLQWAEENAKKVNTDCHLFLQPEWSRRKEIADVIVAYIGEHPEWRLSLQNHKYIGIP